MTLVVGFLVFGVIVAIAAVLVVREAGRIARRGLKCCECVDASGQRLIDFALHPRKRAQVEFGSGVYGHAFSGERTIVFIRSKKYAQLSAGNGRRPVR